MDQVCPSPGPTVTGMDLFEAHADVSVRFAELCTGVTDWDAPTPVKEWAARDVVIHLATWLRELLGSHRVELPAVDTQQDPADLWVEHAENVARLIQTDSAKTILTDQGEQTVGEIISTLYVPDVFMHQYDIAKSSGQEVGWDDETLRHTLAAVEPRAAALQGSGQFGVPVVLDESHSLEDRLASLIGRDPNWTPQS